MPTPPSPGGVATAAMVSAVAAPPGLGGYLVAASIWRVMCHCWAMDRMLFTVQ